MSSSDARSGARRAERRERRERERRRRGAEKSDDAFGADDVAVRASRTHSFVQSRARAPRRFSGAENHIESSVRPSVAAPAAPAPVPPSSIADAPAPTSSQLASRRSQAAEAFAAARRDDVPELEVILNRGVTPRVTDVEGNTLLHAACSRGALRAAKLVVRWAVYSAHPPDRAFLSLRSANGRTALDVCRDGGHERMEARSGHTGPHTTAFAW